MNCIRWRGMAQTVDVSNHLNFRHQPHLALGELLTGRGVRSEGGVVGKRLHRRTDAEELLRAGRGGQLLSRRDVNPAPT
jgi:hypothetical protein